MLTIKYKTRDLVGISVTNYKTGETITINNIEEAKSAQLELDMASIEDAIIENSWEYFQNEMVDKFDRIKTALMGEES